MKKCLLVIFFIVLLFSAGINADAQCSICTKTAAQLGEKKARGINTGIIYLMLTPFAVAGYIGFKWWQSEKPSNKEEE